ncbi:tRNA (guanosine(37)-N1)-methyltransferase TrmD [Myxococcota bacterium]|nr:tRNA (guanosine(37)-N1)-methyltransferase TrmD [Myxococcota bacterium]
MHIVVCTLFPELISPFLNTGLLGKAVARGTVNVETLQIRDFATDRHHHVDDVPFGGGPGMVMKPEPLAACLHEAHARCGEGGGHVIYLSPQGPSLTQKRVVELSNLDKPLILLNGRYEGIDERIIERYVHEEISIGDYVLYGGELGSLVIIEAITRLLPDGVGNRDSLAEESHDHGRVEYPQYTRPPEFEGQGVPEVLISGHHAQIAAWRHRMSLLRTMQKRPDLIEKFPLTADEIRVLEGRKK